MKISRRIWLIFSVALIVLGCGVDSTITSSNLQSGSALLQMPVEDRRIAIVHSETTKNNFYDAFAYNQLFASMQHQAMMAGLPFDLLSESDLGNVSTLLEYDALLLPEFSHVRQQDRAAIRSALLQAQAAGVAIVTSGEFMSFNANGQSYSDSSALMADILGVEVVNFLSGVSATVNVVSSDHPATKNFANNEELVSYGQIWFGSFVPVSGEQSTLLSTVTASGGTYAGAQIIDRAGRIVHFANEQIMADNNMLWSVLQWVVFGDMAPVSLQLSRSDSVFIARNDMDQAMIAADLPQTEIPLLDLIRDWKRDYNFVGSYYIDIGDNPSSGQYTDWAISGPLYQEYIALGSEIGTHSWTHPHHTSQLTETQLEYEFNQSKNEIGSRLGIDVIGGAVPGNAESLAVVENLNQWFKYFSGRSGTVGTGYPSAIGFLEPQHEMLYFSLNMAPDFTLIDVMDNTPVQAANIWKTEIDQLLTHGRKPVLHWLWHDYGPTTQAAIGRYSKAMFEDTLAYAHTKGTEFTTVANLHDRIRAFQSTNLSIGSGDTIDATVDAAGVGQFSLMLGGDNKIQRVANWYAYDDQQVFLPDNGGTFSITPGATADKVTRVTELPMRARLISLNGDGNELGFTFTGEGELTVELSPGMIDNVLVSGADSFIESQSELRLKFTNAGTHTVSITAVQPINMRPVAVSVDAQAKTAEATGIELSATDPDGDVLAYRVLTLPANGSLTGIPPTLVYQSNNGFSGTDSFTYVASDGVLDSNAVTVQIDVTPPLPANSPPIANRLVLATLVNQSLSLRLSGSDNENQALSFAVTTPPVNGVITGTAPDLVYTPANNFNGIDQLEFTVNDGVKTSAVAQVVFNVDPQLSTGGGTLSNTLTDITIDGSFDDWSGVTSFGTDANDISGVNNNIDWREAWMGHDANNFYIGYQQHQSINLSWGHSIYLDTDTDQSTGFRGFANEYSIGVDYALEGDSLFRYTGTTQNEWSWVLAGSINSGVVADRVELMLPRALIGNPTNVRLFFQGINAATNGDAVDYYPDDVTNAAAISKSRRFSYSIDANTNLENVVPVANSQQVNISNNAVLGILLTGFDLNNDPLGFQIAALPQHGVISGAAPDLTYQPDTGYVGSDSLSFTVNDGSLTSNVATVLFNVVSPSAINSLPVANSQTLSTLLNTSVPVALTGSDADGAALSFIVVAQPQSGVLNGAAPTLSYVPDNGFTGDDSFTFKTNDGSDDSAVATVTINVASDGANTAPVADDQNLSTAFETAVGISLTGSDAEDQALSYTIVEQPAMGTLQGSPPTLTYVPFDGASGVDFFTFKANDGIEDSQIAVVTIDVQPAVPDNLPPLANGQTLATAFAEAIGITLTATDPEAAALDYRIITAPVGGVLSGTAPNLVYTPGRNFSGLDSFRFVASDGLADSTAATVTIDVGVAPNGAVSNPVSTLTVDGNLTDWNGAVSFGLDPDDVTGPNNPLDWREVWVAHSTANVYIAYRNDVAFQLSWGHGIYIDTDGNPNTGFRGFSGEFPIGADYVIEADDVHRYSGTGQNWSWNLQGSATVAISGDVGEVSLPRSLLGNPVDMQLYLRADNEPFGGIAVDHYPDSATDPTAESGSRQLSYSFTP